MSTVRMSPSAERVLSKESSSAKTEEASPIATKAKRKNRIVEKL